MTRGLNKVLIIGCLGADPEMRYTPGGKPVTSYSVAVNRGWRTSEGERKEATEWFNVVAWGNLAEICNQYLHKGSQVYVEGRLQTRSWEDTGGTQALSNRTGCQRDDHTGRSQFCGRLRRRRSQLLTRCSQAKVNCEMA